MQNPTYSLFDALGLDPAPHSRKAIIQAYKKATLHCHPDPRQKHKINPDRWPLIHHLDAARAYLERELNDQNVVNQGIVQLYSQYPRTFFPTEAVGSPLVYQPLGSSISDFSHCSKDFTIQT